MTRSNRAQGERWRGVMLAVLIASVLAGATDTHAQSHDEFHWLGEINKASAVMLVEQQIVPRDAGRQIAAALTRVLDEGARPGAARPGDYLDFEQLLVTVGGPDVTRVHSGRSRQ